MLRADNLSVPVDEGFVAVLADQARSVAAVSATRSPRRAFKLAGAAAAVVASTVGVAVAANQGLFPSPDPQRTPPATAPSDTSAPRPVDEDDVAERQGDDRIGEPDATEESVPREDREDAPEPAEGTSTTSTPARDRPSKPGGETTRGDADGQDGQDGPRGDGSSEDEPGDDDRDADGDDGEDDGRDGDDPEESESPEPEESESPEPDEPDEPESDDGSDDGSESPGAGATEPDEDSAAG